MKFSLPNMPVTIYLEFREWLEWDEAITEMDEHTATIVLHNTDNLEDVLLHEVIHAVSHQLRRIGMEHNIETEELYCYTIWYFYKTILSGVKKNIVKKQEKTCKVKRKE